MHRRADQTPCVCNSLTMTAVSIDKTNILTLAENAKTQGWPSSFCEIGTNFRLACRAKLRHSLAREWLCRPTCMKTCRKCLIPDWPYSKTLVLVPRPADISLTHKSSAVGTPAGSLRRGLSFVKEWTDYDDWRGKIFQHLQGFRLYRTRWRRQGCVRAHHGAAALGHPEPR